MESHQEQPRCGIGVNEKIVHVTTYNKDGTAGTVAMWFFYMSGKIYMSTDRNSVKVKRIAMVPSVGLQFKNRKAPLVHGTARVVTDKEIIRKAAESLFNKYDEKGQWWESVENMVEGFLKQCPSVLLEITLGDGQDGT